MLSSTNKLIPNSQVSSIKSDQINQERPIKIVLIGKSQHKSELMKSTRQLFPLNTARANLGVDFVSKDISIDYDTTRKVQIWDTPGLDRYKSIESKKLEDAKCVLLICDMDNRASFEYLSESVNLCQNYNVQMHLLAVRANNAVITHEELNQFSAQNHLLGISFINQRDYLEEIIKTVMIKNHNLFALYK